MSSAILYVAIVAIWACVLIPRWLRRSPAAPVAEVSAPEGDAVGSSAAEDTASAPAAPVAPVAPASPAAPAAPAARDRRSKARPAAAAPRERRAASAPRERRPVPGEERAERPEPVDPAQRRVHSARRRLLMMLLGLTIASGALAGIRMAAWWVIVPPSVMLSGYLLLLREAAKADAERRAMARQRDRTAAAPAVAPDAARRSAPMAPAGPGSGATDAGATIINIPAAPQEIYDQYADAKLRAVGD